MAKRKRSAKSDDKQENDTKVRKVVVERQTGTVHDLTAKALEGLDSVLEDATRFLHEQEKNKTSNNNADNHKKGIKQKQELLAALAFPHLDALSQMVIAYGMQLLPFLFQIKSRILSFLQIPILSSPACWKLCGLLAVYFRASFAKELESFLEYAILKKKEGIVLFHNECFCLEEEREMWVANEVDESATNNNNNSMVIKLKALEQMLMGCGSFVNYKLLQNFALRYTTEWVEEGLTSCYFSANSEANPHHKEVYDQLRHFIVHTNTTAASIQLLYTLLLVTSRTALSAELHLAAQRVVRSVFLTYQSGSITEVHAPSYYQNPNADTVEAAVRLSHVLFLLKNAVVLPHYSSPAVTVEQTRRKVFVEGREEEQTSVGGQPAEKEVEVTLNIINTNMNRPAGALLGHIPLPPATVTPTNNKEPVKAVESPSIPQKTTPVQRPQKAVVHSNNNNDDDDDDDLPDIDMN